MFLARYHVDTSKLCIFLADHVGLSSIANLFIPAALVFLLCFTVYCPKSILSPTVGKIPLLIRKFHLSLCLFSEVNFLNLLGWNFIGAQFIIPSNISKVHLPSSSVFAFITLTVQIFLHHMRISTIHVFSVMFVAKIFEFQSLYKR